MALSSCVVCIVRFAKNYDTLLLSLLRRTRAMLVVTPIAATSNSPWRMFFVQAPGLNLDLWYPEVVLNGVGLVVPMLSKMSATNDCTTRWTALCDENPHCAVMGLTSADERNET